LRDDMLSDLRTFIPISLISLGFSAFCSLLHRYVGPDSIAFHLEYLRRYIRQGKDDNKKAKEQHGKRDFRFSLARTLLFMSALFLWIGAISLAIAFIKVL
jgi:hypothetical protein